MTSIALITGASGGIGRALAHQLRAQGCRVAAVMRVNLDSAVFMLQAWMAARHGEPGAAEFVSSVVARIGAANHEAIAAAKGGVEALAQAADPGRANAAKPLRPLTPSAS